MSEELNERSGSGEEGETTGGRTAQEEIICPPTKWFKWRMLAVIGMFLFFAVWFLRDWRFGYPEDNQEYYHYKAFEEAKEKFRELEDGSGASEEAWQSFVDAQRLYPEEARGQIPAQADLDQGWPEVLADFSTYQKAYQAESDQIGNPLWREYSHEQGWSEKPREKPHSESEIRNQLYYGIGSGVIALIAVYFFLRTLGRRMKVDEQAYYPPDGRTIPYSSIRRIDERKWRNKGIAYLYYEEQGREQKAKVDGMVYGQFDKDDGEPAERLYQRILANFKGELITYEEEDDEPTSESNGGGEQEAASQATEEEPTEASPEK